jgi:hypothetical protein
MKLEITDIKKIIKKYTINNNGSLELLDISCVPAKVVPNKEFVSLDSLSAMLNIITQNIDNNNYDKFHIIAMRSIVSKIEQALEEKK